MYVCSIPQTPTIKHLGPLLGPPAPRGTNTDPTDASPPRCCLPARECLGVHFQTESNITDAAKLPRQRGCAGGWRRLPAGLRACCNCSRCAWRQDHSSVTHVLSASPPLGRTAEGICQWTLGGSMVQDGIPVSWLHAGPAPTLTRTQGVN